MRYYRRYCGQLAVVVVGILEYVDRRAAVGLTQVSPVSSYSPAATLLAGPTTPMLLSNAWPADLGCTRWRKCSAPIGYRGLPTSEVSSTILPYCTYSALAPLVRCVTFPALS